MKKSLIIGITVAVIVGITVAAYFFTPENTVPDSLVMTSGGYVTDVIDGDTIEVGHQRIRLSLTSTPELDESGGVEAKEFTSSLCPIRSLARFVVDDGQPQDQFGRTVAKVYCDDILLNSELLERGLATIDKRFCSVTVFASEDWAKKYGC